MATVAPTAVSNTSRATLERTRLKTVTPSSRASRTSYVRSATVDRATGAEADVVDGGGVRGRDDGSASCCWSTWAGGGPRRTNG